VFQSAIAVVLRALFVGQETARHGVRNSGLLREADRGPKISGLHPAKVPCEIDFLCDKFRTTVGGPA
jgi:hypothetical protein